MEFSHFGLDVELECVSEFLLEIAFQRAVFKHDYGFELLPDVAWDFHVGADGVVRGGIHVNIFGVVVV